MPRTSEIAGQKRSNHTFGQRFCCSIESHERKSLGRLAIVNGITSASNICALQLSAERRAFIKAVCNCLRSILNDARRIQAEPALTTVFALAHCPGYAFCGCACVPARTSHAFSGPVSDRKCAV